MDYPGDIYGTSNTGANCNEALLFNVKFYFYTNCRLYFPYFHNNILHPFYFLGSYYENPMAYGLTKDLKTLAYEICDQTTCFVINRNPF